MKLLLKRHAFSDAYVEKIRKEIPSFFHVRESNSSFSHVSADTLLIFYGSKKTEQNQEILVTMAHQPTNGFRKKITELYRWLLEIYLS